VARQFATLDQLSGGRAAGNVVTSWDTHDHVGRLRSFELLAEEWAARTS